MSLVSYVLIKDCPPPRALALHIPRRRPLSSPSPTSPSCEGKQPDRERQQRTRITACPSTTTLWLVIAAPASLPPTSIAPSRSRAITTPPIASARTWQFPGILGRSTTAPAPHQRPIRLSSSSVGQTPPPRRTPSSPRTSPHAPIRLTGRSHTRDIRQT